MDILYSREIGSFKRFFVYFIDISIVTLIVNLLNMPIIKYLESELGTLNDAIDKLFKTLESYEGGLIELEQMLNMLMGVTNYALLLTALTLPITLLVYFLYFVLQPMKSKYQTLGRKLMNVNVERVNGNNLTYGKLILRELVGTYFLYRYLGTIMILINLIVYFITKRTLADHISGTNMYDIANMNYQNDGYYDNNGNYHDNNGGYYDNNGNYYDNNGGYYDNNGNYYDNNGNYYDNNGNYYENNNYDNSYKDENDN